MKEYDYSRQYNRTNEKWGGKVISIITLLLTGYMAVTHFYELISSNLVKSMENIRFGNEPLSMTYYEPQIEPATLNLICGILFSILFLVSLYAVARKQIQLLYICLTIGILICIVDFFLSQIILY